MARILLGIASFLFLLLWGLEADAYAWGPCIHTMLSMGILSQGIGPIPRDILLLVSQFPFEFIYGALSLDFQLKGKAYGHMHTWEDGFRTLDMASTSKDKAYAIGFLTHLAADIGAHHFFIPRMLEGHRAWGDGLSTSTRHLLWEIRMDRWFANAYSSLARYTIGLGHEHCDEVLKGNGHLYRGIYHLKKKAYKNSLILNQVLPPIGFIHQLNHRFREAKKLAMYGLQTSAQAIKSILWKGRSSWAVGYHPLGD
jgi:hypothetical protein